VSSETDDSVSLVAYHDAVKRLRELHECALGARQFVRNASTLARREGLPHIAIRAETALERLDAAIADAQEVLDL
jgi:hypothetical protein